MKPSARRRGLGAALCWLAASVALAEEPREAGLRLEAGSIARHQIVAVGRDVEVEGEGLAGVTAVNGSVVVGGRVV